MLTIHFLPDPANATNSFTAFAAKLWLLTTDWSVWNSLLFGNIIITLLLFLARTAWWVGVGRDRFFGGNVPDVPSPSSRKTN